MKYHIILNPTSGRGNGERSLPQIKHFFTEARLDHRIDLTEYPGHAIELTRAAVVDGADVVVSAGGDGTCNEVLNGLMLSQSSGGQNVAMSVIPVGRGNDFSFSMGIPPELEASFDVIVQNHRKTVDVGIVYGDNFPKGRFFGNGVGIGFDAVVGFEALKLKWLTGFPSYVVAALKTVFLYFHPPTLKVKIDDGELTRAFLMVSIMNGIRMGGGFYMAPDGDPTDKVFDLCCVNEVSKLKTFPLILKFMNGSQKDHPAVEFRKSSRVEVTSVKGFIPAHADGETVCTNGTRVLIELLPAKLEMITKE